MNCMKNKGKKSNNEKGNQNCNQTNVKNNFLLGKVFYKSFYYKLSKRKKWVKIRTIQSIKNQVKKISYGKY